MSFLKKILLGIILFSLGASSIYAAIPFSDVSSSSPYYDAVDALYSNGIITDNGSHRFRPDETMKRDFYVSLVVGVGCKKCATPSFEDIKKYTISPYVDLPKVNPYFYCVAYADDVNIVRGYGLDTSGKSSCQDGSSYSSVPFCADNTTSRIEAAAILLRRANLWNEKLNKNNTDFSLQISDTNEYWYGYAKKAIEVGLITQKSNGNIGQDEAITR